MNISDCQISELLKYLKQFLLVVPLPVIISFKDIFLCFLSAVHQGTAGEHVSERQATRDGAAAEPKQRGAGETATGLLLPSVFVSLHISIFNSETFRFLMSCYEKCTLFSEQERSLCFRVRRAELTDRHCLS